MLLIFLSYISLTVSGISAIVPIHQYIQSIICIGKYNQRADIDIEIFSFTDSIENKILLSMVQGNVGW